MQRWHLVEFADSITHGKGFLRHSYFGSTAKKVLRRVRKPVFIIPLPEGETDVTFYDH